MHQKILKLTLLGRATPNLWANNVVDIWAFLSSIPLLVKFVDRRAGSALQELKLKGDNSATRALLGKLRGRGYHGIFPHVSSYDVHALKSLVLLTSVQ